VYLTIEGDVELEVFFELVDQASLDQGYGCGIDAWLWLFIESEAPYRCGRESPTCPPLKPTATTPKSWRLLRNLGCIEGADVMVAVDSLWHCC
jgi:hypothetical protein